MTQQRTYDYHYGTEADQYTVYRLPKALFTDECFKSLSDGAKILYGLMLDRMGLSIKNGWTDKHNRVYIYFTLEDVTEQMNCKNDKALKMLAELDAAKGVGLIERVKQGQGKPSIIYVRKFTDATEVKTTANRSVIRLIVITTNQTILNIHLSIRRRNRKSRAKKHKQWKKSKPIVKSSVKTLISIFFVNGMMRSA